VAVWIFFSCSKILCTTKWPCNVLFKYKHQLMKYQTFSLYYFFAEKAQSYCSHSNGDCFACKDIMFLLTWYFIVGYIIIQCKIVVSLSFQASVFNIYRTYSAIPDIQVCGESPLLCPFKLHFLSSTFALIFTICYLYLKK